MNIDIEKFRHEVKNHFRTKNFQKLKELRNENQGSYLKLEKTEFENDIFIKWFLFDKNGSIIADINSFFDWETESSESH